MEQGIYVRNCLVEHSTGHVRLERIEFTVGNVCIADVRARVIEDRDSSGSAVERVVDGDDEACTLGRGGLVGDECVEIHREQEEKRSSPAGHMPTCQRQMSTAMSRGRPQAKSTGQTEALLSS